MSEKKQNIKSEENPYPWINPIGSLGNALQLSGILKMVHDLDPEKKFNIVRRSEYQTVFKNHPAVAVIGHPSKEAKIMEIDFWFDGELSEQNAFQTLASKFELKLPVAEKLFIPADKNPENLIVETIPWKEKNIVISTTSPSSRKMIHPGMWMQLVTMLKNENFFIVQVGSERDVYIKNTYSLLGLTNTRQLMAVVEKANVVVTLDNLLLHVAKLLEKPTVAIWGPTKAKMYGYESQTNVHADIEFCQHKNECLGFNYKQNYRKPCPLQKNEHCMNKINLQQVFNSIINQLNY